MNKIFCNICFCKTQKYKVITRAKKILFINKCKRCDYEFFLNEKKKNLIQNKLDKLRLQSAGLKLIDKNNDFINGLKQSENYINNYLPKQKIRILDVGCSWGYFLKLAKKKGHNCYGLELNNIRRKYVNDKLRINCYKELNQLKNLKFNKIFLFYSLEYIKDPLNFLLKLKSYLLPKGEIIIYTPNKNDHVNSLFKLKEYENFFYEENSINYFSPKSFEKLCKKISRKYKIKVLQGYSLINLINWYFHKKPFSSGYVGEDKFIDEFISSINIKKMKLKREELVLKKLIYKTNNYFKRFLEQNKIANIIVVKIQ